jgi:hypothetical protein
MRRRRRKVAGEVRRMTDEQVRIFLEILELGICNVRVFAGSGDAKNCFIEADHLHNIPGFIKRRDASMYVKVEYPIYLRDSDPMGRGVFLEAWRKLGLVE